MYDQAESGRIHPWEMADGVGIRTLETERIDVEGKIRDDED
jgi:hypothetical protein